MRGHEGYGKTVTRRPAGNASRGNAGRGPAPEPGWPGGGLRPRVVLRRAAYTLACITSALVLVLSGFANYVIRNVASIGGSHAIVSGPSIGAQNILLMGLESRRDWNGNILPNNILAKLHAGSAQGVANGVGGNATNTLILIHIPAGGGKAIGFSIPRDDWVNYADTVGPYQQGKIDNAYGLSMAYKQDQLASQSSKLSQDQLAFQGNEAGRAAAVATVEKLTGVHIDHFAEVNLDGFYELAKVLGGVNVCLKHRVYDYYSGANFRKGYQHLDASQALAFVRQRHGLTNGDLDRTHRQQAFLDSVMQQLRTEGVLSDLTKIQALLSVAKRYVITDSGWNLLQFATQMRSLTAGHLKFYTLPIQGYATISGQDANLVNPTQIKAIVHAAFYPAPVRHHHHHSKHATPAVKSAPAGTITVDVLNGGNTAGLAGADSAALARLGYLAGTVANTGSRATTTVLYGTGAAGNAAKLAALFSASAAASTSLPARTVEVLLGANATVPVTGAHAKHKKPAAIPTAGPQGGAVTASNGIPCVD